MFDLTVKNNHTRIYAYNGTEAWRRRGSIASTMRTSARPRSSPSRTARWSTRRRGSNCRPTTHRIPASPAAASAARSVFTIWWWRSRQNQPDIVVVGGVATPTFGEATIRSIDAGASFSGFGNDAQNPRNNFACGRARGGVPSARSRHRMGRIRWRRGAQRRRLHQHLQPVRVHLRQFRAVSDHAVARPGAAVLPEQGTADHAVLQRVRRPSGAASPADRRSAGQRHHLAGRHHERSRVEAALSIG